MFAKDRRFTFPFYAFRYRSRSLQSDITQGITSNTPSLSTIRIPFTRNPLTRVASNVHSSPFSPMNKGRPMTCFHSPIENVKRIRPNRPTGDFSLFRGMSQVTLFMESDRCKLRRSLFVYGALRPISGERPSTRVFPIFVGHFRGRNYVFGDYFPGHVVKGTCQIKMETSYLFRDFPYAIIPMVRFTAMFRSRHISRTGRVDVIVFHVCTRVMSAFLSTCFFHLRRGLFYRTLPFRLINGNRTISSSVERVIQPFTFCVFVSEFAVR